MLKFYLKIIAGTLLVSPLVYAFFDLSGFKPLPSTLCLYIPLWILGILMFNYLENGNPFDFNDKNKC